MNRLFYDLLAWGIGGDGSKSPARIKAEELERDLGKFPLTPNSSFYYPSH